MQSGNLGIALAGGAIGASITAVLALLSRAAVAWREVPAFDSESEERNSQLAIWVDDRTRDLAREMELITETHIQRNTFRSSMHAAALAEAKAGALHEFRDELARARIDLARLRAKEGPFHALRRMRGAAAPAITPMTLEAVEPFLDRWREPVTSHGLDPAAPLDRTRRTPDDARRDLRDARLT